MNIPVYLDEDVRGYLSARAASKGIELDQMVNDLLKRDIEMIEAIK